MEDDTGYGSAQSPTYEDWGFQRATGWKLKFCWIPTKCFLTGKNLWFKRAYHGVRLITGPGEPITNHYWVGRKEFILWNLKGRI